ncbi:MAG: sigma-70 family RNA polymerase sigma factor [SAR324 cluster bacterium]|nr:sigma-70 family RNA polymerase sigma factor [SAR324 cluster bacterium]
MESNKKDIQNVEEWAEQHGDMLYRFALARLSNEDLAADLVQNTFIAAIGAKDSFQGKSSVKTWLLGILKHKMMDHFRQKKKENNFDDIELDSLGPSDFTSEGSWRSKPHEWYFTPEQILENKEAQKILWECVDTLPERMRLLFILREIDGESTETICEKMDLSTSNFSVLLYRARYKLRKEFVSKGINSLKVL